MNQNPYNPAIRGFDNLAAAVVTGRRERRRRLADDQDREERRQERESSLEAAMMGRREQADSMAEERKLRREERAGDDTRRERWRGEDQATRASEREQDAAYHDRQLGIQEGRVAEQPMPAAQLADINRRADQAALAKGLMVMDPDSHRPVPRTARDANIETGRPARAAADPAELESLRSGMFVGTGRNPRSLRKDPAFDEPTQGVPDMLRRSIVEPGASRPVRQSSHVFDIGHNTAPNDRNPDSFAPHATGAPVPGRASTGYQDPRPGAFVLGDSRIPNAAEWNASQDANVSPDFVSALSAQSPADQAAWRRILVGGDLQRIKEARRRILAGGR